MDRKEILETLKQLGELHEAGILTEEEFQQEKAALLQQLRQAGTTAPPAPGGPSTPGGPTSPPTKGEAPSGLDFFSTGGGAPPAASLAPEFATSPGRTALSAVQIGQILAQRYRLDRFLGSGGMGQVFLCHDLTLDQTYALKLIHPHLAQVQAIRQRFINELKITERLTHPGIVRTYSWVEEPTSGLCFYTMEFVQGEPLESLLTPLPPEQKPARVPLPRALALLRSLTEILDFAHEQGVVHRDLKPNNIMILPEDHVKIMDFGIARVVNEGSQARHTGFVGTAYYMAPEQLQGGAPVTPAADIYALGVLFYQMLAGQLPLGSFLPLSQLCSLPDAVDSILQQALAPLPEQRFKQASLFSQQLDELLTSYPLSSEPTSPALEQSVQEEQRLLEAEENTETSTSPPSPSSSTKSDSFPAQWEQFTETLLSSPPAETPPPSASSRHTPPGPPPSTYRRSETASPPPRHLPTQPQSPSSPSANSPAPPSSPPSSKIPSGSSSTKEPSTSPSEAQSLLQQGKKIYLDKEYERAEPLLARAATLAPHDATASYFWGKCKHKLEQYKAAAEILSVAARLDPQDPDKHYWLGMAYYKQKNYQKATEALQEASRLQPHDKYNRYWLGKALYNLKHFVRAEPNLEEAVRLDPNDGNKHYWLGMSRYRQRRYKEALPPLQEAILLQPSDGDNRYWLGLNLYRLERYPEAEQQLQEAVKLDSHDANNHYWLGLSLYRQRRHHEADVSLRQAVKLDPRDADNHYWLGMAYFQQEKYLLAEKAFQLSAELAPNDPNAFYMRARALLLNKRPHREVRQSAEEALRLDPENEVYRDFLRSLSSR